MDTDTTSRNGLLGIQDFLTNLFRNRPESSPILDKVNPRDVGINPDYQGDPGTGMLYPNVAASGVTPRNTPTFSQQQILDAVNRSGDFTYDANKAAGRGMPTSAPATTTGRVNRPAASPAQPQTPSPQVYYLDRGDGSPLIPMGSQLPKGMSTGSQQGGGYIFGAPAPTRSLFGSNPKPAGQVDPLTRRAYPPVSSAQPSAPRAQPQPAKNYDYGDRMPPLAAKQLQDQQPVATPIEDKGWRESALSRNQQFSDLGLSGDKAGGRIDAAHRISREKATPCHSGIINMAVGGRTDHIPMNVLEGSYVLPADIVSGLGEGNTLAGSKILDNMFQSAPFGTKIPTARANPKIPALSFSKTTAPQAQAAGGRTFNKNSKPVPIIAAGGEYVVHPDIVAKLGNGDMNEGHEYLDNFVKYVRAHTAKTLQNLPGPRKD